jgi:Asp-tRNA(Asn)/Glu-tRNA(Gln) amidotransferase A subunit family amidase
LDGVPVPVKDEVEMLPFGTTVGTRFLGKTPAKQDSTVVARMRATGALMVGKCNMHEIGIGVTGLNPHHGTVRNPYNINHHTGGSSSGPAAAVAAGFGPVAIGADGGGSIRLPSGFCGVVGLKTTYSRVSEFGAAPLCWSVAHLGPIAGTARVVAMGFAILAGADHNDPHTHNQPEISMDGFSQLDLSD